MFGVCISALLGGSHFFLCSVVLSERRREREREKQILFTAKSLTPKHQRQREGERERGETDVRREGYALYPGNDGGEREGGMERDRETER